MTASANDPDASDVLTYNWEQMDNGIETMPPVSTNLISPMFRSFFATQSPSRYFPRLTELIANNSPIWEVLPSVSRDLNFRCTIRDNGTPNGCTDETNMIVTTTSAAGPFLVTSPNSAAIYEVGGCLEITWDVANTSVPPINATTVDVFLSTDGGLTYPTTLASNVPNNGFTAIETPDIPTTNGRIMVKASDNIFFDISNEDFTIQTGTANYNLCATEQVVNVCTSEDATFTFTVTSISNYRGTVNLSTSTLPGSTTAGFSSNPVTPGDEVTLTISNTGSLSEGLYPITINGSASSGNQVVAFDLSISDGADIPTLTDPADGATDLSFYPTLTWATDPLTNYYELEVATDAAFGNIVHTATSSTNTHLLTTQLSPSTTYYWRLRAENDCGTNGYSATFSFTTHGCITYSASDLPITISSTQTGTYTSTINIPDEGIIEDINIINVIGDHDRIKNLIFTLKRSGSADAILLNRPNCLSQDFDLSFDSDSPNANSSIPCPPNDGLTYQPVNSLSVYNNETITGDWQFEIKDQGSNFGGEFQGWSIEVCPVNYVPLPCSIADLIVDYSPSNLDTIKAENSITTQGIINISTIDTVVLIAGNDITLSAGFIAEKGSSFTAYLDPTICDPVSQMQSFPQSEELEKEMVDAEQNISKREDKSDEFIFKDLKIYPNPTNGKLKISGAENSEIQIIDIFRNSVKGFKSPQNDIDITHLPSGVYFLIITKKGVLKTQKIVKL